VARLDLGADPLPRPIPVPMSHPRAPRRRTFDGSIPPFRRLDVTCLGMAEYILKGVVCQEENDKTWGAFSSHPGETWTKSFRSGRRVTKDRTFIFTSRQKAVFCPLLGANQPLAPSIRKRSTVHSAQIGIHRVIRVHVEGIRGQNLRLRIIEVNRYGGRLHLPQPKMLEDPLNDFLVFHKTDDLHPSLTFRTSQGTRARICNFRWTVEGRSSNLLV
jgi:hypothetical protein